MTDIFTNPEFTHKQIELLYDNDFSIDPKIINEILSLPRQSLINDLNKVLKDSIDRYEYFNFLVETEDIEYKYYSFLAHALFLLAELEAKESVENVFDILRQDDEFFEFYLGDILTEYMWLVLYKITNSDLDICKSFILESGIDSFAKGTVTQMVCQIGLHFPERNDEIIGWYREIFNYYLSLDKNKDVIDYDVLGHMIIEVVDLKATSLIPQIKELFDREMVDYVYVGTFEDFLKHIEERSEPLYMPDISSIKEIYEDLKTWYIEEYDDDEYYDEDSYQNNMKKVENYIEENYLSNEETNEETNSTGYFNTTPYVRTMEKIGRNDPCPCGSGKKYKNCCLKL